MSHGSLQPTTRFSKLGSYFIWVGLRDPNIFLHHVQHVGTADEIVCFKVSSRAEGARHGVCKTCVPVGASIFQLSAGNTQWISSSAECMAWNFIQYYQWHVCFHMDYLVRKLFSILKPWHHKCAKRRNDVCSSAIQSAIMTVIWGVFLLTLIIQYLKADIYKILDKYCAFINFIHQVRLAIVGSKLQWVNMHISRAWLIAR